MAGTEEAAEMEFPLKGSFADLNSQNFFIIEETITYFCAYALYFLSLCLVLALKAKT